ncbi:MAG: VWA domain-containing protein, partial [Actinomycetota bacterium]|nr:VWA domain-containing protein [Actinomycetota bacterium]
PQRRSRRTRPSRRRSPTPDLRRTLRTSLRHAGEPIERRWRAPTTRQRPLVMVCDVSGSMTPYARALLRYVQACVAARRRVEAFAFGTRLTRVTRELAGRDPDAALRRATAAMADFSGGTRIGAAIGTLNRVHGRRIGRGSAIVILSDGWDRGDPYELAVEMARLRRSAHRLVWLNPLAAHPSYAPLTRGMQAALPHAHHLLAGNTLASLEELVTVLEEM